MPRRKEIPPADSDEITELREEVTDLKNHVRVLVDAIDEIRVELQWVTRNGLPIREPLPTVPILKRMALDPCADDWGERLVIDYGESPSPRQPEPEQVTLQSVGKPPPGKLFGETGEQRRLF